MQVKLKKGVSIVGMQPQVALGVTVIAGVWEKWKQEELVITSVTDGKHGEGSLHYKGQALDLRIWGFAKEDLESVKKDLCLALNGVPDNSSGEWDVVVEATHIHVEFDPK